MDLILPRRRFIQGLVGLLAAPAIVRLESLMPVRALDPEEWIRADPVLTFQWLAGGKPIPGATSREYTWTGRERGPLRCRVTATKLG